MGILSKKQKILMLTMIVLLLLLLVITLFIYLIKKDKIENPKYIKLQTKQMNDFYKSTEEKTFNYACLIQSSDLKKYFPNSEILKGSDIELYVSGTLKDDEFTVEIKTTSEESGIEIPKLSELASITQPINYSFDNRKQNFETTFKGTVTRNGTYIEETKKDGIYTKQLYKKVSDISTDDISVWLQICNVLDVLSDTSKLEQNNNMYAAKFNKNAIKDCYNGFVKQFLEQLSGKSAIRLTYLFNDTEEYDKCNVEIINNECNILISLRQQNKNYKNIDIDKK